MAKKITSWQANDGSLHTDECAAATRDVEILVEGSPLAENVPFARQLVKWLTGNAHIVRKTLEAHEAACPTAVDADDCMTRQGTREEGTREEGTRRNPPPSDED